MLSPKRATLAPCPSCHAHAARIQVSKLARTCSSCQWPTTTLRFNRIRVLIKPNSRPPWADWLRFMKSMSMADHGISLLNCVCRCTNGFCRAFRPAIHIFAGEKVCIHVIRPMHSGSLLASKHNARMASGVVTTGLKITCTGIPSDCERPWAIRWESSATCRSVSSPYRSWLPVTNQTW